MANYAITRKGKSAMKLLRDYQRSGKRVGKNCEVFLATGCLVSITFACESEVKKGRKNGMQAG